MKQCKNRAIFLDRDGVINQKAEEHDYIKNWSEFKFLPGVAETIKELNKDFLVVVISNQRGVARGMVSNENLQKIHNNMKTELEKAGAKIDAVYFCPHDNSDNCFCRKPKPGMILKAAEDLNIDLKNSFMIGDSQSDVKAGKSAGCTSLLFSDNKDFSKILEVINKK